MKPGKNQHAFCTDSTAPEMYNLCNINPIVLENTILHERVMGYSYYNDRSLPFILRDAALITTEAIANFFCRLRPIPFDHDMGLIDENESRKSGRTAEIAPSQMIVFSRWARGNVPVLKSMYENPDQDLTNSGG